MCRDPGTRRRQVCIGALGGGGVGAAHFTDPVWLLSTLKGFTIMVLFFFSMCLLGTIIFSLGIFISGCEGLLLNAFKGLGIHCMLTVLEEKLRLIVCEIPKC